jgi:hypothetical protein
MALSIGSILGSVITYWYIALPVVVAIVALVVVLIARRRMNKKAKEIRQEVNAIIFEPDRRYPLVVRQSEIKDFASIKPKKIGGKLIYVLQKYRPPAPEPVVVPEGAHKAPMPVLSRAVRRKHAATLATLPYLEQLNDGQDTTAVADVISPAAVMASAFKYEALKLREVPMGYRDMTPNWLWRRLHWEEQTKWARVKPSGLMPALKLGAAIVILVLFVIVIFLFGTIIAGGG